MEIHILSGKQHAVAKFPLWHQILKFLIEMWSVPGVNLTLRAGGNTQLNNNRTAVASTAIFQQQMMMIQSLTRQVKKILIFEK